jgi:hypothetical protein
MVRLLTALVALTVSMTCVSAAAPPASTLVFTLNGFEAYALLARTKGEKGRITIRQKPFSGEKKENAKHALNTRMTIMGDMMEEMREKNLKRLEAFRAAIREGRNSHEAWNIIRDHLKMPRAVPPSMLDIDGDLLLVEVVAWQLIKRNKHFTVIEMQKK